MTVLAAIKYFARSQFCFVKNGTPTCTKGMLSGNKFLFETLLLLFDLRAQLADCW